MMEATELEVQDSLQARRSPGICGQSTLSAILNTIEHETWKTDPVAQPRCKG